MAKFSIILTWLVLIQNKECLDRSGQLSSRRIKRDLLSYNRHQNILFEQNYQSRKERSFVSMLSKAQLYEAARLAEIKFQADEKILQKIRYLKTECICRLFCTGPTKSCEELMRLETIIST